MTTQMGAETRQTDSQKQMQSEAAPQQVRTPRQQASGPAPRPQMGGVMFDDWAAI